ncbi:DUF3459 domain-containing protein [Myxococcota bacterium]|nr:DUF3459 domain-containing protein [Myxococcota bacterium]
MNATWRITRLFGSLGLALLLVLSVDTWLGCLPEASTKEPPTSRPAPITPQDGWWRDAVFYQIFLRSFKDSDGDGIGDFEGLIRQLDYLNDGKPETTDDLGVTAIWLLPVFSSPSYHGYDTTDYRQINKPYGTNETFARFVQEAHKRGIKVVLDLVINHTSSQHPWFLASQDPASSYRPWYVWRSDNPGWTQPWGSGSVWHPSGGAYYYGIFWKGMPDLNFQHEPVRKEITSLAQHWLKAGVDGYRLDAARYIVANGAGQLQSDQPETLDYWRSFRNDVKQTRNDAVLIGEVWSDTASIEKYCKGDQLDLAFHFPMAESIYLAITAMSNEALWKTIQQSQNYPLSCWAPFLTNHDQIRIMSRLRQDLPMMRNAAKILLTLPGTPFVYYGEEFGMLNGNNRNDEAKRTPFAWNASPNGGFTTGTPWEPLTPHDTANVTSQSKDPQSLLSLYRKLIHLRNQQPALRRGDIRKIDLVGSPQEEIFAALRSYNNERIAVFLNLSDKSLDAISLSLPTTKTPHILFSEGNPEILAPSTQPTTQPSASAILSLKLPANAALILKL